MAEHRMTLVHLMTVGRPARYSTCAVGIVWKAPIIHLTALFWTSCSLAINSLAPFPLRQNQSGRPYDMTDQTIDI